jgi:hypothetical protein
MVLQVHIIYLELATQLIFSYISLVVLGVDKILYKILYKTVINGLLTKWEVPAISNKPEPFLITC